MRERKKGEREVVPSQSSCSFMENTEPANRHNSIPLQTPPWQEHQTSVGNS